MINRLICKIFGHKYTHMTSVHHIYDLVSAMDYTIVFNELCDRCKHMKK